MSPHRVIVLRHGRTAWNAQRRFQGQADPPLDDLGRAQAFEAACLLAALRPEVIVSSDAQRATETAAPLADITGVEMLPDVRLRERSLGHWEGLTREEVQERYPEEWADWLTGREVSRRGGETREQVALRAREAFDALPDVDIAVLVTHSATAMALCASVLGLSPGRRVLAPLANCHWSELRHDSSWQLRAHNVGAPGPVIPFAVQLEAEEEPADAEA